jgi:putative spermidine/putrescine transport system permease protein
VAAVTAVRPAEEAVVATAPPAAVEPTRRRRQVRWFPVVTLLVALVYFGLPLLTMARFSFQRVPANQFGLHTLFKGWTIDGVRRFLDDEGFWPALWLSTKLAFGSVVAAVGLLLPTALWAHLRVPKLRPVVEVVTVLPYVVPPIALVVGVAGTFRDAAPWFLQSDWSLVPFYAVLAMPFTYRSLDAGIRAVDLRTLTEASRSCGAGWWRTVWSVVLPNLRASVVGASFLTATVVLGEFTIASLLLKDTLPLYMAQFGQREPQGGMALALVSLFATALLLGVITSVSRRRGAPSAATVL